MMDWVNSGRHFARIYRILCFLVLLFYGLYPFFDKNADGSMKLPLPLSFPFDTQNYYFVVYSLSIFSMFIGAWTNSNIDILTIMLVTLGTSQLEILKYKLDKVILARTTAPDEIIQRKLKEHAEHLKDIYRLVLYTESQSN